MGQELKTLQDLLTRSQFRTGLIGGLIAALILTAIALRRHRATTGWALSLSAVLVVGINIHFARRLTALLGLGVMGLGAYLLAAPDMVQPGRDRWRKKPIGWALLLLGVLAFTWRIGALETRWAQLVIPVVVLGTGHVLSRWKHDELGTLLGPMVAITAFGIWGAVPETDTARVLLGAALPMSLVTLRPLGARLNAPGAFTLAALIAWVVALGGQPRPASMIGAWACLGLLVLLPIVAPYRRSLRGGALSVLVLHASTVLVSSRVIGLWESVHASAGAALILAAIAALILRALTS